MKKLAVLGASYLQLPLVNKAKEQGIEVHCFAWDNDEAVCKFVADYFYDISVLDKEKILDECTKIGIDGITTIATDICIPTVCHVAQKLGLVSNTFESAMASTNKALMRDRFLQGNVNSPKYASVTSADDEVLLSLKYPVIVKPTDRSGSRGVEKVNNFDELKLAINRALEESFEKKCVVESFVEGKEISVEAISWQGNHTILAITDKVTTGAPFFVELEHHQPTELSTEIVQRVSSSVLKALDVLGIQFGASHSEFKITPDGEIVIIEVGARMGGDFIGSHLVFLSKGYDFLKGVIDVALNQFEEPRFDYEKHSGVYFLSKETEYLLPFFSTINEFDVEKKVLKNDLKAIENSNDRSGYLIYQSDSRIKLRPDIH